MAPSAADPQQNAPSPVPPITYPMEPLLDAMGCTLSAAARSLGIGGPEYRKYRDEGMPREVAERKALKAGFHPYEIVEWNMAEHDFAELSRECEAEDCTERFIPSNNGGKHRKFCSARCANRIRLRRYRARSEAARERDRQYAAAYYRDAKAYVLRRQAAYDREHREQINARRRRQEAQEEAA